MNMNHVIQNASADENVRQVYLLLYSLAYAS